MRDAPQGAGFAAHDAGGGDVSVRIDARRVATALEYFRCACFGVLVVVLGWFCFFFVFLWGCVCGWWWWGVVGGKGGGSLGRGRRRRHVGAFGWLLLSSSSAGHSPNGIECDVSCDNNSPPHIQKPHTHTNTNTQTHAGPRAWASTARSPSGASPARAPPPTTAPVAVATVSE
jgi:hypothetical protein